MYTLSLSIFPPLIYSEILSSVQYYKECNFATWCLNCSGHMLVRIDSLYWSQCLLWGFYRVYNVIAKLFFCPITFHNVTTSSWCNTDTPNNNLYMHCAKKSQVIYQLMYLYTMFVIVCEWRLSSHAVPPYWSYLSIVRVYSITIIYQLWNNLLRVLWQVESWPFTVTLSYSVFLVPIWKVLWLSWCV